MIFPGDVPGSGISKPFLILICIVFDHILEVSFEQLKFLNAIHNCSLTQHAGILIP